MNLGTDGGGKINGKSPLPPFFKGGNSTGFQSDAQPAEALPPLKKRGRGGFAFALIAALTIA
ncbi:MAG: hypothetical protein ACREP7_18995, partial [Lysobacter sp.]